MGLQAVGAEARAAALYGLAVYEAAGVVDVVLLVRPVGAGLGLGLGDGFGEGVGATDCNAKQHNGTC